MKPGHCRKHMTIVQIHTGDVLACSATGSALDHPDKAAYRPNQGAILIAGRLLSLVVENANSR